MPDGSPSGTVVVPPGNGRPAGLDPTASTATLLPSLHLERNPHVPRPRIVIATR
ncbi:MULTISPECIES: hypothetical protein [unclassified Curtobacterium]|uniref:hypothetical protein n=1 Tax=unclassified Curtobacterium TaxID=257496 RepID=UPI00226BA7CF|nr:MULTISPECIES: hypothetical protein [unclassified Curtobacterium]